MEHFEVHKEMLEDLIVDLNTVGPAVFDGLPDFIEDDNVLNDDERAMWNFDALDYWQKQWVVDEAEHSVT